MENNNFNPKPTSDTSAFDILSFKELIDKYSKRWYWFVISIIFCLFIGYFYLKVVQPEFEVTSTILLRKDNGNSKLSEMSFMIDGLTGSGVSKEVEDEMQLLSSKSIIKDMILELNIQNEYFIKRGMRFQELYPTRPLNIITPPHINDSITEPIKITLKKKNKSFQVEIVSEKNKEKFIIEDNIKKIQTSIGTFRIELLSEIKEGDIVKVVIHPIKKLTESYSLNIRVGSSMKKSNGIKLTLTTGCAKKGEDILNAIVALYNINAIIDKNTLASNTAKFVDERLQIITDELQEVELNMEQYKKLNSITDIKTEAEIFVLSSNEYNKKLSEIESKISLISSIESDLANQDNQHSFAGGSMSLEGLSSENKYPIVLKNSKVQQYALVPSNVGIDDRNLSILIQEYNRALLERMKVLRTTNPENPLVLQMEEQLKTMRSNVLSSIKSLKDSYNLAKKQIQRQENNYISKIKQIPNQERQFVEISRQKKIKSDLYLFLLKKREENALSLANATPSAKTVDSAHASLKPISPKPIIVMIIAFVLGLGLPIFIVYLMELLNDKIADKKELQKLIKVPFIGSIGINKDSERVIVNDGNTSPVVEMFKLIRTNLQFMLGTKKSPVLLVTSSISGEGKSFTSINVAMTFALLKKKVVIVGLDIRNPMLVEYMHIPKNIGVSLYLSDPTYTLSDIIVPSGFHPSLSVIPAGPIPPNPAELLMSHKLDELIGELKAQFDYIIVDSAPVGLVSDTFLLNRFVDNTLYVVRKNYTPRDAAYMINDLHLNNKLNNIAVVLNGISENEGYGYGYSNQKKKKQSVFKL